MRFKTIVIVLAVAAMLATLVGTAAAAKPGGSITEVKLEALAEVPHCVVRAETSIEGSGWLEHTLTVNELTPKTEMVRLRDGATAFFNYFIRDGEGKSVSATYDTALYADRNKTQLQGVAVHEELEGVPCFSSEPGDYINLYANRSGRYWSVGAVTVGWKSDDDRYKAEGWFTPQPGGVPVEAVRVVVPDDLPDIVEFYSPPFDKKLFDSVDFELKASPLTVDSASTIFSDWD